MLQECGLAVTEIGEFTVVGEDESSLDIVSKIGGLLDRKMMIDNVKKSN